MLKTVFSVSNNVKFGSGYRIDFAGIISPSNASISALHTVVSSTNSNLVG